MKNYTNVSIDCNIPERFGFCKFTESRKNKCKWNFSAFDPAKKQWLIFNDLSYKKACYMLDHIEREPIDLLLNKLESI